MSKLIPTITLENGNRYEIKRNRYILCEIDELSKNSVLTEEENKNYAILQDKYSALERLAKRVKELEDKYFETFEEKDGEVYERAKTLYNKVFAETAEFEAMTNGVVNKAMRATINRTEQLVIKALTLDENGDTIRTNEEATDIWCTFVDEIGHQTAQEWLLYAFNYLSGNDGDNDSDPFVENQKAKAQRKANMRKGIAKAK